MSYGYFSDRFELKTESYAAGQQVFISYGKQSNDRLLQFYGFVDDDNPHDVYDFGAGFVDVIVKYADLLSVKVPAKPSPKERLETVAAAITRTAMQPSGQKERPQKTLTGSTSGAAGEELTMRCFRTPPAAATTPSPGGSSLTDKFDDVTVRALRVLYSSSEEWDALGAAGRLASLDALGAPLSAQTEKMVTIALSDIVRLELQEKATSLEDDLAKLQQLRAAAAPVAPYSDVAAVAFRVQKKKLLSDALKSAT